MGFIRKCVWAIIDSLHSFLKNSNLHGLRYIAADNRRAFERVLWLVLVIGAFAFMTKLSSNTWIRFSSSVTLTTLNSTTYPVKEVHFPAVAICSNSRFEDQLELIINHMTKNLHIDENRTMAFIDKLDALVRPYEIDMTDVKEIEDGLLKSQITLDFVVRTLTTPCKVLIRRCQWLGRARNCERMFRLITTGRGFCCAFNYYGDRRDDVTEQEAERNLAHLALAGYEDGLLVMVNFSDPEEDRFARVMVGHPFDFMDLMVRNCRVGGQQELSIPLRPTTVHSSPAIRSVDLSRRSCYFDDEIELKSSSIYSYATCVTQCRMDQIWNVCRCIPFNYLRYDSRRNCTMTDVPCLNKNRNITTVLRPQNGSAGCKCLPRCSNQWYDLDCKVAELASDDYTSSSFMHGVNFSTIGIISVSWADTLSFKYTRDVSLTWDTFLGSFGGILSLCVGGSVISVVELLYFILIRTCTGTERTKKRSGKIKRYRRLPPARQPTLQLFWAEFTQNLVARSEK